MTGAIDERELFDRLITIWAALAALTFAARWFVPAPYGRYARGRGGERASAGRAIAAKWGWFVMESPAVFGMLALYAVGRHGAGRNPVATVFLSIWLTHYVRRTLVYPFRLPPTAQPLTGWIVACGFSFQIVNVYLNGRWLFELAPPPSTSWFADPRFLAGVALFAAGSIVNRNADAELLRLRALGPEYRIAEGGLFRWIGCPHYLGEIGIWCGWALLTWCLPALVFALWTIANLAPRAWSHHRHARATIPGYPRARKALLPGIW